MSEMSSMEGECCGAEGGLDLKGRRVRAKLSSSDFGWEGNRHGDGSMVLRSFGQL